MRRVVFLTCAIFGYGCGELDCGDHYSYAGHCFDFGGNPVAGEDIEAVVRAVDSGLVAVGVYAPVEEATSAWVYLVDWEKTETPCNAGVAGCYLYGEATIFVEYTGSCITTLYPMAHELLHLVSDTVLGSELELERAHKTPWIWAVDGEASVEGVAYKRIEDYCSNLGGVWP